MASSQRRLRSKLQFPTPKDTSTSIDSNFMLFFNFLVSSLKETRVHAWKLPSYPRTQSKESTQFALFSFCQFLWRHLILSVFESVYWNLIEPALFRLTFAGLSSLESAGGNKMLHKNQFLLSPHVPARDSSKTGPSNSTVSANGTSESSDLSVDSQSIVNSNFLMESHNDENHIAMMNENDENYFEIFRTPMKFGTENNTEVTAQIGTTAHLPCTIHSIGEGVVSTNHFSVVCATCAAQKCICLSDTWKTLFHFNSSEGKQKASSLLFIPPSTASSAVEWSNKHGLEHLISGLLVAKERPSFVNSRPDNLQQRWTLQRHAFEKLWSKDKY